MGVGQGGHDVDDQGRQGGREGGAGDAQHFRRSDVAKVSVRKPLGELDFGEEALVRSGA